MHDIIKSSKNKLVVFQCAHGIKGQTSKEAARGAVLAAIPNMNIATKGFFKQKDQAAGHKNCVKKMEGMVEALEKVQQAQIQADLEELRPVVAGLASAAGWDGTKAEEFLQKIGRIRLDDRWHFICHVTDGSLQGRCPKFGEPPFSAEDLAAIEKWAEEYDDIANFVKELAGEAGWDEDDKKKVCKKLHYAGMSDFDTLKLSIKDGRLNQSVKKSGGKEFSDKTLALIEDWAKAKGVIFDRASRGHAKRAP